jgi:hypothetical protein
LPSYIDLASPAGELTTALREARLGGEFEKWAMAPRRGGTFSLTLGLTSLVPEGSEQVRFPLPMEVRVLPKSGVPDRLDVFHTVGDGCGGGETRDFSVTELQGTRTSTARLESPGVDFLFVVPNEYEQFYFPIICAEPGIYDLEVRLRFSYEGAEGESLIGNSVDLVCPQEFTFWFGQNASMALEDGSLVALNVVNQGTYVWRDGEYVPE